MQIYIFIDQGHAKECMLKVKIVAGSGKKRDLSDISGLVDYDYEKEL